MSTIQHPTGPKGVMVDPFAVCRDYRCGHTARAHDSRGCAGWHRNRLDERVHTGRPCACPGFTLDSEAPHPTVGGLYVHWKTASGEHKPKTKCYEVLAVEAQDSLLDTTYVVYKVLGCSDVGKVYVRPMDGPLVEHRQDSGWLWPTNDPLHPVRFQLYESTHRPSLSGAWQFARTAGLSWAPEESGLKMCPRCGLYGLNREAIHEGMARCAICLQRFKVSTT